jgi:hypothetical protein
MHAEANAAQHPEALDAHQHVLGAARGKATKRTEQRREGSLVDTYQKHEETRDHGSLLGSDSAAHCLRIRSMAD